MPEDEDLTETDSGAGLVRAVDLIGQLADPLHLKKLNALYGVYAEIGVTQRLGYSSPADLLEQYPQFFWGKVGQHIGDALRCLEMTMEGKR